MTELEFLGNYEIYTPNLIMRLIYKDHLYYYPRSEKETIQGPMLEEVFTQVMFPWCI